VLRTVMEEIDVAIFTFDNETTTLVNRAGERLLARPVERCSGFTATELGSRRFFGRRRRTHYGALRSGRLRALGNAARVVSASGLAASFGGT